MVCLNVKPLESPVNQGYLAEREGFEPSIRYNRIPDFESGAFDHSATSPHGLIVKFSICEIYDRDDSP